MTIVGILGTVHGNEENRIKLGYPIELMKEVILDFKPEIILGEVRPEDFEKYCQDKSYSGYLGPYEYRNLILPLCEENNISFEPVDWFESDLVNFNFDNISEGVNAQIEEKIMKMYEEIFEVAKKSPIPFNSFEFDKLVREKQDYFATVCPIEAGVHWDSRNYIMTARIKKAIQKHEGKRILCTVGAEHNYYYYKELKKLECEIVYPIK